MIDAICVRCGTEKRTPWKRCTACGFDPTGNDEDLIKSVYLSVGRFEDPERRKQYREELDRIARGIRKGEPPIFDPIELDRLRTQKSTIQGIPPSAAWMAVVRFFLPGIGFLLLLWVIVLVLRSFK